MRDLFLGIDTSNYTTSTAVCDGQREVLVNYKKLLPVNEGERGLRQSDALFHHTKALPEAAEEARRVIEEGSLRAVGVSCYPRDEKGSYMPCFLAGISAAEYASMAAGVPLYRFSHQAGHVAAALWSATNDSETGMDKYLQEEFLAFHISGGTTELLHVEPDDEKIFKITKVGGTLDLNAGQVIDRTGVMMGMRFPAGAEIDALALEYGDASDKRKTSVSGLFCNLSGLENKAAELWKKSCDTKRTAAYVLSFVSDTIEQITEAALESFGQIPVLYAGGVMSSGYIKKKLSKYGMFASPRFSSDNAAGCAILTQIRYSRDRNK